MTVTAHRDAARRFRVFAQAEDVAGHLAQERGDALGAADHLDEREFWHALADHHDHAAEVRARTLIDA